MEPVSINPTVLTPDIIISPSFEEPTNLSTKLGLKSTDEFGPFSDLRVLTSSVCPTTEEVNCLKESCHPGKCYHGEHHGR